jgi:hypothetical protein
MILPDNDQFIVVYILLTIPDHRGSRDLVSARPILYVPQCS